MKKKVILLTAAIIGQLVFFSVPVMAAEQEIVTAEAIGVESGGAWGFNDGGSFLEGTDFQQRDDNAYGLLTGGARWTDNGFLVYRFELYKNAIADQTQLWVKIAGGNLAIEFASDNIDYALVCGRGGSLGDTMEALYMGAAGPDSDAWFAIPVAQKYVDSGVLYVRFSNSANYANEPYYTRMGFAGGGPWLAGYKMVQVVDGDPIPADSYIKSYEVTNFGQSAVEAPYSNYIVELVGAAADGDYIYTDFDSYVVLELPVQVDTAKAYVELTLSSGYELSIARNQSGPFTKIVDAATGGAGWASGAPGEAFAGYLTVKRIDLDSSYAGTNVYVKISNRIVTEGNGGRIYGLSMNEIKKADEPVTGGETTVENTENDQSVQEITETPTGNETAANASDNPRTGYTGMMTAAVFMILMSGVGILITGRRIRSKN